MKVSDEVEVGFGVEGFGGGGNGGGSGGWVGNEAAEAEVADWLTTFEGWLEVGGIDGFVSEFSPEKETVFGADAGVEVAGVFLW